MVRELDPVAAEWEVFRDLTASGRSDEVLALADRIAAESSDPARVAQALIEKLVALVNLGRGTNVTPLLDEIVAQLRRAPVPRLVGEFHVMAGHVAYLNGSLDTAVTHLVHAERALRRMDEVNLAASDTWHDLSVTYSHLGFHAKALEAMRECRHVCAAAGLPLAVAACLQTLVRSAVALDQRGSTGACVRELTKVVHFGGELACELVAMERVFLRYAVARLAALEHTVELEVAADEDVDAGLTQINYFTGICEAITAGDTDRALALLDAVPAEADVLGAAEPLRLRSLALARRGDLAGARDAERAVLSLFTTEEQQLRDQFTGSIGARLDQDRLRRLAAQHADAAYTDPLTGLPNRRRIDTFAAALRRDHVGAAVGVLDLDGFKLVNDTHGHVAGDIVLQRIAGILARSIRQSDLLARYGGDEFVLIQPATTLGEAEDSGLRIRAAVAGEDWEALVPGTPVSLSIGWAELSPDGDLVLALHTADRALYQAKRVPRR